MELKKPFLKKFKRKLDLELFDNPSSPSVIIKDLSETMFSLFEVIGIVYFSYYSGMTREEAVSKFLEALDNLPMDLVITLSGLPVHNLLLIYLEED